MSKARRKARQDARIKRKQTRVEGRVEAKQSRIAKRRDVSLARVAKRANSSMKEEPEEISRVADVEDAEHSAGNTGINGANLDLKQVTKMTNYVKRQNRTPEKDPELLAAQVYETREQQIQRENAREIAAERAANQTGAINQNWGIEDGEVLPEYQNQDETEDLPDFEDTHENILEQEEQEFSFDGNEDNFLDPATLGVALSAGKAAADKYREKQFAKGKKAFGKTKAQWDAEQAKKTAIEKGDIKDPSIINAAKKAAEESIQKETVKSYTNEIWIGSILLVVVLVSVYYYGKKS